MSIFWTLRSVATCSSSTRFTTRNISLTYHLLLDQNWRQRQGLPANPNAYGPLTDGPDYTYLDGRRTPIGSRLKKRLMQQREHAKKIIEMTKEIDFAVELHEQKKEQEENARKRKLEDKFKPKGKPLLMQPKIK